MGRRTERVALVVLAVELVVCGFAYLAPPWSVAGLQFGRSSTASTSDTPSGDSRPVEPSDSAAGAATVPVGSAAVPEAATGTLAAGWVKAENAREGSDGWRITARNSAGFIEGYARQVSTQPGVAVALYIDTAAPSFTVEAYRMGFYGGKQGRLMWASSPLAGARQRAAPKPDRATGLVEARWTPSLTVPVGRDWPPGVYLIKLVSASGDSSYIPLTVRDDTVPAQLLVVDAVTTWQAYNTWGGCSLYECPGVKGRDRAVKVSFDRPYSRAFNDGSADFFDHELPLIALAEQLGIDTAYSTSIDVHDQPALLTRYHGVLSMGHDEYYTAAMRQAIVTARDHGVNVAFFGANAIYRHIRLESSGDGTPDRVEVNYRSNADPAAATDRSNATIEWRSQGKPEASIVGIQYLCANVSADLVVASANHWIWAGAGVHDGQHLTSVVGNEADGLSGVSSPVNISLLAVSPIRCGKTAATGNVSYYTTASGAGVFASGTIWWVCALEAVYCSKPENIAAIRAATANILIAFAKGPAAGHA